ncbi:unnamed protein product [Brassica oleracea var. botrytis]|uniref:(rape) hypothetical protein n=1 Tax=Brassica napus TaxID=3708 RepID=A0A816M9Y7_BRANA|nr:unnamed protein product [Brassica napus]
MAIHTTTNKPLLSLDKGSSHHVLLAVIRSTDYGVSGGVFETNLDGLPRRMVSSGEILCQEIILLKSKPARFSSNYWNSCVIYANTPADGLSKLQDSILELKPRRIITGV